MDAFCRSTIGLAPCRTRKQCKTTHPVTRTTTLLSRWSFKHWNYSVFKPMEFHEKMLGQVTDQVIAWGGALRTMR